MKLMESKILNEIRKRPFTTQKVLSENAGLSVGIVNKSVRALIAEGYLDESYRLTEKAVLETAEKAPERAVILAAGVGMRMVPINNVIPKAMLEVYGEVLIERTIRQLHEAGIKEIYVVAGFMKESLEYLIDEYNVELIVNPEYGSKNNLHTLYLAREHLENCYIIPSDIWMESNPYSAYETYSWYMMTDSTDINSTYRVNRRDEIVRTAKGTGRRMVGITYLLREDAAALKTALEQMNADYRNDDCFWEEALVKDEKMPVAARVVENAKAVEINTYEQLRELDENSSSLDSDEIRLIMEVLRVSNTDIKDICVMKKGMTNRSFLFSCGERKYIMRIPGEGTSELIDRKQEAEVYGLISAREISEKVVYIDPDSGIKISEYLKDARCCDADDPKDVKKAMKALRTFHDCKLKTDFSFDIFGKIDYYESLAGEGNSAYRDYHKTKENVMKLRNYIESNAKPYVLAHIDSVPDNFLFVEENGKENVKLIDWEYSAMQDPDVDIAMFCIYALYDREKVDALIDAYYTEGCSEKVRIKIYCYISCCGLLWSNWCDYKRTLGIEFGEYALRQYRYAKDYYKIAEEKILDI